MVNRRTIVFLFTIFHLLFTRLFEIDELEVEDKLLAR